MPPFAVTVISRPHGPCGLFMASFTRIITLFLFVYGFELALRFSRIFTVMESQGKEFAAYFEDDNLLRLQVSRSHSPTMDTELFRVISPLHTRPTDAASETELPNSVKVQGSLNMGAKSTVSDAEALGVGERRKIPTDKGKQHELQRLKDHRTVALRHVTRQINKMKPLLADLNNYEFVSVEMEGLNNLLVKLQDTQDNYVDALENETDIANANSWYDAHDGDIFQFKQSVIEYLTKAKRRQSAEVNSVISGGSHHTKKSNHSKQSTPSSISSKAKLIEAKTKVAALEIEVSFLKEKQALKMAAEQLELKQSLAQAREEERIYEEMKNEESTLAPVHAQSTPICTMQSGNFAGLEPTSQQQLVSSLGVTDYQQPLQASPLGAFTVPQKGPIYTAPINTGASQSKEETTAYTAKPHEHPSSVHSSSYPSLATTPAVTYTAPDQVWCLPPSPPQGCSTSLSVKDNTFQDIVEIQRKQTELSQTIVNQQARSLLPSNEPPMFYGDAMEYPLFMTAFESLIESKVEDSQERLYFLGQYTSGKAKEIINGCLQRKMEGSYEEAKRLLKRQFGDPFKIANAHITKLSSWPPIRPNDGLALQDFSIALDQAKCAMKGMSHMDDLNTAHVLRQLWEKLPKYLRTKWTERNNRTKSAKGRIADFEEFSQFVREQADLATDPVFSEQCASKPNHDEKDRGTHLKFTRKPLKRGKGTNLATGVNQEDSNQQTVACSLCKKPHNLNECELFLKKSLSDRRDFVVEKKLCFGCFSDQHIAKHCKERQMCKTCNKQHPTSLHNPDGIKKSNDKGDKNQPQDRPRVSSNHTAICNITEAGDVPINMGILPVWLFHKSNPAKKIRVYAILDNASGGTFVNESSAKALGVEGSDTDLTLTTIHGTRSVTTRAIEGLVVANVKDESAMLDLPRTFTRNIIPADRSEIPRPDVISRMSHLKNVSAKLSPYMEDVEVGLLIGLNCPSALRPREIVYGGESDPYAVRSLLGWYINGPLYTPCQWHLNVQ